MNRSRVSGIVAEMAGKDDEKRQRIVDAATALFSRYGYKRTSIEQLASEAQLAKPTIYSYFDGKDAIFRAAIQSFCDAVLLAAENASRKDGPMEKRVTDMLVAKFTRYFELVQSSPHAAELIGSHGMLGQDIVERTDERFLRLLAATIEKDRALHPARIGLESPLRVARLLIRAASGAAYDAKSAAEHRRHIGELVRAVILGLRGGAAQKSAY